MTTSDADKIKRNSVKQLNENNLSQHNNRLNKRLKHNYSLNEQNRVFSSTDNENIKLDVGDVGIENNVITKAKTHPITKIAKNSKVKENKRQYKNNKKDLKNRLLGNITSNSKKKNKILPFKSLKVTTDEKGNLLINFDKTNTFLTINLYVELLAPLFLLNKRGYKKDWLNLALIDIYDKRHLLPENQVEKIKKFYVPNVCDLMPYLNEKFDPSQVNISYDKNPQNLRDINPKTYYSKEDMLKIIENDVFLDDKQEIKLNIQQSYQKTLYTLHGYAQILAPLTLLTTQDRLTLISEAMIGLYEKQNIITAVQAAALRKFYVI